MMCEVNLNPPNYDYSIVEKMFKDMDNGINDYHIYINGIKTCLNSSVWNSIFGGKGCDIVPNKKTKLAPKYLIKKDMELDEIIKPYNLNCYHNRCLKTAIFKHLGLTYDEIYELYSHRYFWRNLRKSIDVHIASHIKSVIYNGRYKKAYYELINNI